MRAGSAEGLSVTANVVEMMCYTVIVGYNVNHMYPFSSYGDVFACWLQDIIVTGLIVYHMRPSVPLVALAVAAFASASWWIISGACGLDMLLMLQVGATFAMTFGARLPQILLNMKRGDSGELAPISCGLSVAGNLVRVFTTIVLTADMLLLASTVVQLGMNGILFFQTMQTELRNRAGLKAHPA